MAEQQNNYKLPLKESRTHRLILADGATFTCLADANGILIQVVLTRRDATPIAESFPATVSDGQVQQTGASVFEMELSKIKETTVLMRPDHALDVAVSLVKFILANMTENQRAKYNLPKFEIREG